MKASITYLNTYILGYEASLIIDRPDRPVAVISCHRGIMGYRKEKKLWG